MYDGIHHLSTPFKSPGPHAIQDTYHHNPITWSFLLPMLQQRQQDQGLGTKTAGVLRKSCKHQELIEWFNRPVFSCQNPSKIWIKRKTCSRKKNPIMTMKLLKLAFGGNLQHHSGLQVWRHAQLTLMSTSWSCKVHERLKDVTGMETCHSPQE